MSSSGKSPWLSILFWSVISAAFIGPGTVTTAARAGADFGFSLLWALLFSTLACIVLQEAAARLPLISGLNLGQAIAHAYGRKGLAAFLAAGAILLGGIAYQAGNILGAVSGLELLFGWDKRALTGIIVVACGLLLWLSAYRTLAHLMGFIVAAMGIAFVAVAMRMKPGAGALLEGSLLPHIPLGADYLVIGLIGTTIVPYNLFLGSGLSRDQGIGEMRLGIGVAVLLGGIISMAILVAGSSMNPGSFSFDALAEVMQNQLGPGATYLFGFGLFAAGFTSSLTAPLAAAITVESIFTPQSFGNKTRLGRVVWGTVLAAGFVFGISGFRPIPVILMAQAFNGLLLPLASLFLLMAVNDARLVGPSRLNPPLSNLLLLLVTGITTFLGLSSVIRVLLTLLGRPAQEDAHYLPIKLAVALLVILLAGLAGARLRRKK